MSDKNSTISVELDYNPVCNIFVNHVMGDFKKSQ